MGLTERGPIASRLLPALGPLYWPLQLLALLALYALLRRRGLPGPAAGLAAGAGPLMAAAGNAAIILEKML